MTTYPVEIWTVRSYVEEGYSASLWCEACREWRGSPDLPALVAAGQGEKPLRDLPLTCARCRGRLGLTIKPSPGFGNR